MNFFMVWNKVTKDFVRSGTPIYMQRTNKGRHGPRVYTNLSDAKKALSIVAGHEYNGIDRENLEIIEFLPTFQNPSLDFMSWYTSRPE